MLEYEDILNWEKVKMLKTVPLEGIYRTTKRMNRNCKTCGEYNKPEKDMCIPVGIIANPDYGYCSWYKDKAEVKTIRGYRSLK